MIEFDEIKKIKSKKDIAPYKNKEDQIDELYKISLNKIYEYHNTKNRDSLKEASLNLYKIIHLKRSKVEPYVWLSFIYHILKEENMAIKYLKLAEGFNPDYPKIKELRTIFNTSYVVDQKHDLEQGKSDLTPSNPSFNKNTLKTLVSEKQNQIKNNNSNEISPSKNISEELSNYYKGYKDQTVKLSVAKKSFNILKSLF